MSAYNTSRILSAPNDFDAVEACVFGLVTVCLSVFTVASNAVIIHLTKTSSELKPLGPLRSFIGSMAWSDLLMGLIVMPLATQYNVIQGWHLGEFGCIFYQCAGFFCFATTSLHHTAIALDRYLAIMHPVAYRNLAAAYVRGSLSATWAVALLTTSPLFLMDGHDYRKIGDQFQCDIARNVTVAVLCCGGAIALPQLVLWTAYSRLYCISRRRLNDKMRKTVRIYQDITNGTRDHGTDSNVDMCGEPENNNKDPGCFPCVSTRTPFISVKSCLGCHAKISVSRLRSGLCGVCRSPNNLLAAAMESRIRILMGMSRRTLFVTLVITCTFAVCCVPIGIQTMIPFVCPTCQVNPRLVTASVWIAMAMATVNPVIYWLFNVNFRNAFKRLLHSSIAKPSRLGIHL